MLTIDGYAGNPGGAHPATTANPASAQIAIEISGINDAAGTGLQIQNFGCIVQGLVINQFTNGIAITSPARLAIIDGNFIGTDITGLLASANTNDGILMTSCSKCFVQNSVINFNSINGIEMITGTSNFIGGNNIIANGVDQVRITDASTDITVQGNTITNNKGVVIGSNTTDVCHVAVLSNSIS